MGGILDEHVRLGCDSFCLWGHGYAGVDAGQGMLHTLDPQRVIRQHFYTWQRTTPCQKCVTFQPEKKVIEQLILNSNFD